MEPPMPLEYGPEVSLGQAMFGQAELDDERRTARLVATFDALCRHPGGTLPDKLSSPAELKALYRLCACASVTHAALVAAARGYTLARIATHDRPVLLVHDATELDYSSLSSLAEHLGQIGKGAGRGDICHNVLAVDADTGDVLGLMDQVLHCRDDVPEDETLTELRGQGVAHPLGADLDEAVLAAVGLVGHDDDVGSGGDSLQVLADASGWYGVTNPKRQRGVPSSLGELLDRREHDAAERHDGALLVTDARSGGLDKIFIGLEHTFSRTNPKRQRGVPSSGCALVGRRSILAYASGW
jgi:hypothetical protein